jgi:hypothetical protein
MSDLKKALALIEKEKLEKTGELDLGYYDLSEVPEAVKDLVWLKRLTLERNLNLEKLPNWIYELNKLQKLSCSFTKIDSLKPIIKIKRYTAGNTIEKSYHYPRNKLHYIVRVMQEFELCFQLDRGQYIIPQLLPVQEADFNYQGTKLHFEIQFPEFLPTSIFPRMMVKLHTFIKDECFQCDSSYSC